ncbi:flagellar motor protein MotD [Luteimonas abyssi]|uniref:flagellar motor protein MotD n=1 Tax=Luteimonas abyssi TaxID=1247514 RepID=UPI0009EB97EB|nr:flagellar motor protein MotD [Luteimonas abyssi]
MARRKQHEEHANHEAWAIPYADLMTLLLAFFVVMYAISSLNEGKYRVLAESLANAFSGTPRTVDPIQIGESNRRESDFGQPTPIPSGARRGPQAPSPVLDSPLQPMLESKMRADRTGEGIDAAAIAASRRQLDILALEIEQALAEMVRARLITIHRADLWLEVEINSDILFETGSAALDAGAQALLTKLAGVLGDSPNPIRVEGYTDDRPIRTLQFPSNWELSAGRAASVVHLFVRSGLRPERLVMVGYGEHRPKADNATEAGRNANRRVVLMVLAPPDAREAPDTPPGMERQPTASTVASRPPNHPNPSFQSVRGES